ncbi:hypothetical protein P3X46_004790 [Hevea brasiliensis]|uniref:HAT C-terminal dimerisation domain-containing protein n=1 Tax=Hevea brasiliensis TaxID=3981 RepID=A0ABQ9N035_HEVBR|nr:hypothetical protein P3X46_004790 [Hevea brasiliensis]
MLPDNTICNCKPTKQSLQGKLFLFFIFYFLFFKFNNSVQWNSKFDSPKLKFSNTLDAFVKRGHSMTRSTQTTINQLMKKELREEACQQITCFFFFFFLCLYVKKVGEETVIQAVTNSAANYKATGDFRFWRNVIAFLKAAYPLIKVLQLVDSDETSYGFYLSRNELCRGKNQGKFQQCFHIFFSSYEPTFKIMDERWEFQLHKPLHVTAYYVNPHYHYSQNFLVNANIKIRLYNYIERVVPDLNERCKIDMQLKSFKDARGLFGIEATKLARDKKAQAKWWDSYGAECPELEKFVIQVVSLTYSSSGFLLIHLTRISQQGGHESERDEEVPIREDLDSHEGRYDMEIHDNDEIDSDGIGPGRYSSIKPLS